MKLHIHSQKSTQQELNLFGYQTVPTIVISLLETKNSDVLFQFNSLGKISTCIKQLEPVKFEVMQLIKDHYNIITDTENISNNTQEEVPKSILDIITPYLRELNIKILLNNQDNTITIFEQNI